MVIIDMTRKQQVIIYLLEQTVLSVPIFPDHIWYQKANPEIWNPSIMIDTDLLFMGTKRMLNNAYKGSIVEQFMNWLETKDFQEDYIRLFNPIAPLSQRMFPISNPEHFIIGGFNWNSANNTSRPPASFKILHEQWKDEL
jgi:hypothetical protein